MSVIARTMQLLDQLGSAAGPLTLTELSTATGLPLTTTHRLCTELIAEGVVERLADGGLRIGPRLWEFGRRFEPAERFRQRAARYLHDLHEVSRATVELTHFVGDGLVIIERLAAPDAVPTEWSGHVEKLPLGTTAPGIAVLAQLPRERAVPHHVSLDTMRSRAFERELDEARTVGAARRRTPDGSTVLASAILGRAGIVGAVSLSLRGQDAARLHLPSLRVTARRIGAALLD